MGIILLALDPNEVQSDISQEKLERARELAGARRLVITNRKEEIETLLGEIEAAAGNFPVGWVERAPALRWFQQWFAGADWLKKYPAAVEKDFILTNNSGVHAISISEHILACLLAFARALPNSMRAQQERRWARDEMGQTFELAGKVMLLVGVGAIGQRTAQLARGLGMRVWGVRRSPEQAEEGIERMVGPAGFHDLLPEADFVVLTIPATEETQGMVGREALERMKPSAYLVNIGRGKTVDEAALVEALRSGKIAGAGLDVFETEPLPPDSPLWEMPNVILTPHIAGEAQHYNERTMDIFLDNLQRYTRHLPLNNVVDKKLGY